jgi:hypothetical protein
VILERHAPLQVGRARRAVTRQAEVITRVRQLADEEDLYDIEPMDEKN